MVHDGATSLRAMMAKLGKPLAAFSHCEKTHSFQSPFPLCVPPPTRRWLLICPVRKNSARDLAERGLALSAVPVSFPPRIRHEQSDYTSVQRRIRSFSPTNDNSTSATSATSATSQPKQEFSDNPVGAVIPAAICRKSAPGGVSPIAVQSRVTVDRFCHRLR